MNGPERCAYVYARVKATMTLRTSGDLGSLSGLRHGGLRLSVLVACVLVLLVTMLAGASGAGVSAYQGTLYFAGPASSLPNSFQMTTAVPAAQGAAPVAAAGVAGSGGLATAAYRYIYVTSSGGALTASAASNQLSIGAPGNTPVLVSNVPVGADLYRATIPSGTSTGRYTLVG